MSDEEKQKKADNQQRLEALEDAENRGSKLSEQDASDLATLRQERDTAQNNGDQDQKDSNAPKQGNDGDRNQAK